MAILRCIDAPPDLAKLFDLWRVIDLGDPDYVVIEFRLVNELRAHRGTLFVTERHCFWLGQCSVLRDSVILWHARATRLPARPRREVRHAV